MPEMTYMCPVCGYPGLPRPPKDWLICSCCGTQFDYFDYRDHDYNQTHEQLRERWITGGMRWWSEHTPPPDGWDAAKQVSYAEQVERIADAIANDRGGFE